MLMKWRLSKIFEKDKEANKELDEWMHHQLDKNKKREEDGKDPEERKKDPVSKPEDEKRAALKKELRSMEWSLEDDEEDDSFFVNGMARTYMCIFSFLRQKDRLTIPRMDKYRCVFLTIH